VVFINREKICSLNEGYPLLQINPTILKSENIISINEYKICKVKKYVPFMPSKKINSPFKTSTKPKQSLDSEEANTEMKSESTNI